MNNVTLIGRLVKDPELRYLQSGDSNAVCRFTLAVDKQLSRDKKAEMESRGQSTADFINIVVWGKMGETVSKFTQKGKRVAVQGRIQTGSYKAQDGSTRYTTDVVASNVEFIDWKDDNSSFGGGQSNNYNKSGSYNNNSGNNKENNDDFGFEFGGDFDPTIDDGKIPF